MQPIQPIGDYKKRERKPLIVVTPESKARDEAIAKEKVKQCGEVVKGMTDEEFRREQAFIQQSIKECEEDWKKRDADDKAWEEVKLQRQKIIVDPRRTWSDQVEEQRIRCEQSMASVMFDHQKRVDQHFEKLFVESKVDEEEKKAWRLEQKKMEEEGEEQESELEKAFVVSEKAVHARMEWKDNETVNERISRMYELAEEVAEKRNQMDNLLFEVRHVIAGLQ